MEAEFFYVDGLTDMSELIVAFRDFVKGQKKKDCR